MLRRREPRVAFRVPAARVAAALGLALAVTACAVVPAPPVAPTVSLPLNRAWVDGQMVEYVSTDTSDADLARAMGLNAVPRLADALPAADARPGGGRSLVERVYAFPGGEQLNVFASAPRPAGADNRDTAYSPLWRMVTVQWLRPTARRTLRSEEAILQAQDQGDVALTVTRIVINCPVLRSADGQALPGLR